VKTQNGENVCQCYLADQQLHRLLEKVDADLAQKTQAEGCCRCGDKLYYDSYARKPRGGPATWDKRYSFTCATNRHRVTPPSVRFLGPKVYVMVVVVLISAMRHGLKAERVQALRESLGIDRRTVQRWRAWWLEHFVQSSFWKAARSRFLPLVCERTLPWSLCEAFGIDRRDRLLDLLKFLSPITTGSVPLDRVF
jgi:hypothetical protein